MQASLQGNGQIASFIAPANHAWEPANKPAAARPPLPAAKVTDATVELAAAALSAHEPSALFLGGRALRAEALELASRIAQATGARILCETFPARLQRGAGRVRVERLPYFAEQALYALAGLRQLLIDLCFPCLVRRPE